MPTQYERIRVEPDGRIVLITIDRLLDTIRTMANVEGDAVVAVCVARLQERR